MNHAAALGEEDEESEAAIWGILRKLGAQRLQCPHARLIKQALCGAVVQPFRWERKPKRRSSLAISSRWAQIWPNWTEQRTTFEFERVHSGPGGSSLRRQQRVPHARKWQGVGSTLANWLAIAPAALAARAAGTMPGGYCRNNGTWGSPDDAKVGPTPLVPQ